MACRRWRELSTTDFAEIDRDGTLVVLPIGSTEQHGQHLPVGTDTLIVEAVVDGVVRQLADVECFFLPTLWVSKSSEHRDFLGTITLSRETLCRVVEDIAGSVARAGFRKLVFLNAHGGNTGLLDVLGRDIRQSTGLLLFDLELWGFYTLPPTAPGSSAALDIHAGYYETSVILAQYPQLVAGRRFGGLGSDRERGKIAASFRGFHYLTPEGKPVNVPWVTGDFTDDGVMGDPTEASAEVGQREFDRLVNIVCDVLREAAAFEYREASR
jgi:creatinine amidohydrolase